MAVTDAEAESEAAGSADMTDGATTCEAAVVAEEEIEAAAAGEGEVVPDHGDC